MSTVSGLASKADKEKGSKQKYSSLNINSLYKGKSLDHTKTVEPTKHGLQTLGKVGAGRRVPPPANLPSLKSEISGKNTNVTLVSNSGGQGWAKKDQENTTSTQNTLNSSIDQNQSSIYSSISETNGLTDSTNSASFVSQTNQSNVNSNNTSQTKTWSNVTNLEESSPKNVNKKLSFFSQEFPSLDGGDNVQNVQKPNSDTYGPGPSLRPQTVGNWSKGTSVPNQQQEGDLQQNNGNCVNGLQESSLNQDEIGTRAYNTNTAQNQPRNLSVKPNGYPQSNQHNRQNYQNRYNNQNNGSYNNQYNNYPRQYDNRNRQQNRPREEMPERLKVSILSEKDLQGFDELLDNKKLDDWTKTKNQIDFNAKLDFSEDEDQKSQDESDEKEELSEKADSLKQNNQNNMDIKKAENSRYRRDYSNPRPHQSYNSNKSSFPNERSNYQVNLINSNSPSSNLNLSSKSEVNSEDSKKLKLKPDVSDLEKAKKRREEEERKFQLSRQAAQEKLKALEERYKQTDSQVTDQQQPQTASYKSSNRYSEENTNSQNEREEKNKDNRNYSVNRNNDNFNNNNRQFQQSLPPRFKKLQQNLSYNNRFDSNNNSRINNDQQQKYYKQADRKRNDSQSSGQEIDNEGQKRILNRQTSWRNNREPLSKNKAQINDKNVKDNLNKNEEIELISDLSKRTSDLSVDSTKPENEFKIIKNDQSIMTDIKNEDAIDQNLGLKNITQIEFAKTDELTNDKNDKETNSNISNSSNFVDKKNNLTEIKNLENKVDNINKKPCDFSSDSNKQKSNSLSQDNKIQDNLSKVDLKKDNSRHRNKDNEDISNTRNNQRYDNRYDRNRNDDQNYPRGNQRDYRRQNDKLSKNDVLSVDNRRKKHETYNEDYKNYNQMNRNKYDPKKDYRNDYNKNVNNTTNKDLNLKSSLNSNKSSNFNDTKSTNLHINRKPNETHDYRNEKDNLNKSSNDKFDNKDVPKKMNNRNLKERKVLNENSLDESNSSGYLTKKQYKPNQDSKNSKWVENEESFDRNKYKEKHIKSNSYEKKNDNRVQINQRKVSVEDNERQKSNSEDNGQHKKKIKDQNDKQKPKIENFKKPKVNSKNKQNSLPPRFFKDNNSNYKDIIYQKDGCLENKKLDNKAFNKRKTNKEDSELIRSNKNLSLLTKNGLIVSNIKNTDTKTKPNDTTQNTLNKNILNNSSKSSSFDQQDSGIDLSDQLASNASSQRSSPSSNTGKTNNNLIVSMSCLNNVCKTTSSTNLINSLTSKKSLLRTTNKFVDELGTSRKVCSVIFENPKNKTDKSVLEKFSDKLDKKITTNESSTKNEIELNAALHFAHSEKGKNETESKIDFSFNKPTPNVSKVVGASRNVCEQVSPSTDDLNLKIASVKNVWENMPSMPSVLEINNEDSNVEHKYEENKLRSPVRSVDQNVHVLSTINSSNNSNNSSFSFANAIKPISNEELKKTHQQLYQQPHATNQQVHLAQQQSQHQVLISSSPPSLINHINNSNLDNVRRVQNQYQLSNMQRISSPSNLIYNSQSQVGPGGPVPQPTASANVNIYQQFANQMKNMHQGTIMAQFAHVQAAAQQQSHHFATTQHMIQQHQRNHLGQANTMFVPQVPTQLPVQQVPQQVPQPGQVNTTDYRLHQQNLAASHLMKQHFVQTPSLHPGTLGGPPVQPTQSVQAPPTAFYQNQNLPAAQKAYYNQQVSVSVPQHALGHHQQQPQPIAQQMPQQHVQPQQQQFNYITSQQFGLINAQNSQLANNQNYRNSKRFI